MFGRYISKIVFVSLCTDQFDPHDFWSALKKSTFQKKKKTFPHFFWRKRNNIVSRKKRNKVYKKVIVTLNCKKMQCNIKFKLKI